MGNDDERELTDAELAELVGSEEPGQPVTGPREKAQPSRLLKQHGAWMAKESASWTPEELAHVTENRAVSLRARTSLVRRRFSTNVQSLSLILSARLEIL